MSYFSLEEYGLYKLKGKDLKKINGGTILLNAKVVEVAVAFVSGFVGCYTKEELKEAAEE